MKKNSHTKIPLWIWILIAVFMGSVVLYIFSTKQVETPTTTTQDSDQKYEVRTLSIGGKVTIKVEVADTPEKTTLGLSYRESLPENFGMLFIFSEPHIPTFWMKEMNFPLDMIWIREDNTIVDITQNVPQPSPGMMEFELPHYSPSQPAKMVLE